MPTSQKPLAPAVALAPRPTTPTQPAPVGRSAFDVVKDYASIARPDHWGKNVFMVVGVLLALFYHPDMLTAGMFVTLAVAVAATCLIASSNYTLNEILDAP